MQRRFDPAAPEWMDEPQSISRELEIDLRNLRQLNRFFGSHALIEHFLRRWIRPDDNMRLLDLATASGDIPRLMADFARRRGARLTIDAVDQQESTLEIARRLSGDYPEISYHCADVLAWESAHPYDMVVCSLVLHHFSADDAVRLLRRCRELSRRFVLVSDLRRGWLATAGVYALTSTIFREPMTKNDARVSAERAFSFAEFRMLSERAGWADFHHERFRFARQAVWAERVPQGTAVSGLPARQEGALKNASP
jgi:2-polyprenyl-3-methyl-5-hydroxy-6-metoxy-1,4-benzoquinol methylase